MSADNLLPQIPRDRLLIPLAEVAEMTGWSERSLLDDCRDGVIDHTCRKGTYSFRPDQIDALVRRYERAGSGDERTAAEREAQELAEAREANAERMFRRGRGRAA